MKLTVVMTQVDGVDEALRCSQSSIEGRIDDSNPEDPRRHLARAHALLASDPATALEHASFAVDNLDVGAPEMPDAVIALARALFAAQRFEEVVGLAEACRANFEQLVTLTFLAGRALSALGRPDAMVRAFERCLVLGEKDDAVGLVGAGSFLPAIELARFAESRGDRTTARQLYEIALRDAPEHARVAQSIAKLDAEARAAIAHVPPRLTEQGPIATKACRHGVLAYPVHDTFVGKALDLYGEWCEAELELLLPMIQPGGVVVDVGANIGTHAVAFARRVGPRGRVVALEPQSCAHALLVTNATNNGLSQIECLRLAAGSRAGAVAMPIVDPSAACNFGSLAVQTASSPGTEAVSMTTIDALELASCALLKIDVEGLEVDVLEGAKQTIARTRPILFVENNTRERSASILRAVKSLGYRAYWHVARYYRQDNFFANTDNVFAIYQPEANLICVPAESEIPGLVAATGDDDDFVAAMQRGALEASAAGRAATSMAVSAAPTVAAQSSRGRPLKIVACIPGREFSGRFFDAWNEFSARCHALGIELTISRRYDAVVYYARNKVAGGNVRLGPEQGPWAGEVDYDYMLWIDSDVIFRFEDFQALLAHKVDVAAGLYLMAENTRFAAVEHMDPKVFERAGEFDFLTPAAVAAREGLVRVDYCGFGFVLVRRGVFERLAYPWFRPVYFEAPGGAMDFTSEDVGFCLEAKKAGIEVYIDPRVIVGHEKPVVLEPARTPRFTKA